MCEVVLGLPKVIKTRSTFLLSSSPYVLDYAAKIKVKSKAGDKIYAGDLRLLSIWRKYLYRSPMIRVMHFFSP